MDAPWFKCCLISLNYEPMSRRHLKGGVEGMNEVELIGSPRMNEVELGAPLKEGLKGNHWFPSEGLNG